MKNTILKIILLKLKIEMKFLHKYMLLSHPGLKDTFILRTQSPLLLCKIVLGDIDQSVQNERPEFYLKINSNTALFLMGALDEESAKTNRNDPAYILKIMNKMADFYSNSLKK